MIVNGEIVFQAKISAKDRGYTLGDGLFETIPLYSGKPFLLGKHMERMDKGAAKIFLRLPMDEKEVEKGIETLLLEQPITDRGVARLTVTRGEGPRGYAIDERHNPTWTLDVNEYHEPDEAMRKNGVSLHPVSIRKNSGSPLCAIKSTSALERILILDEAKKSGGYEALTLTTDGFISSGAAVNVFWVTKGKLYTPSVNCAILEGITRSVIIDIAEDEGIEVIEGEFALDKLSEASEIFITNSLIEVLPVAQVKGFFNAPKPGPVTLALAEKYRERQLPDNG